MESKNETARFMDMLMSVPGSMNESVKVDFKLSRKQILLLSNVVERGLNSKEKDQQGIMEFLDRETFEGLSLFADECLKKAGLTEFNEKLKALSNSKA